MRVSKSIYARAVGRREGERTRRESYLPLTPGPECALLVPPPAVIIFETELLMELAKVKRTPPDARVLAALFNTRARILNIIRKYTRPYARTRDKPPLRPTSRGSSVAQHILTENSPVFEH